MRQYQLLDLFCGAGGAAMGYHQAGFRVYGVDINPQPRYPFVFLQDDAINRLKKLLSNPEWIGQFDVIHASPPCQAYSAVNQNTYNGRAAGKKYQDLIPLVRSFLKTTGKPYVIENVERAPLIKPVMLCGSMFGLKVIRHRIFESNIFLRIPGKCHHRGKIGTRYFTVCGTGGDKGKKSEWQEAMGINWMTKKELTQAIPPAYTEYLGKQLIRFLDQQKEVSCNVRG